MAPLLIFPAKLHLTVGVFVFKVVRDVSRWKGPRKGGVRLQDPGPGALFSCSLRDFQ